MKAGKVRFVHDDFNHYDDFIGYKDLDILHPDGRIEVIRNPYGTALDLSPIEQYMDEMETFGNHVYGMLPDGSIYKKHYHHDHPWNLGGWNYGYGYVMPYPFYKSKPVYTGSCQSRSACQVTHGCC